MTEGLTVDIFKTNLDLSKIDQYFPMEKYRPGQKAAIEKVLTSFNNGKKIVILEAPTGSGKCLDGATLVLASDGSRIPISELHKYVGSKLHSLDSNLQNTYSTLVKHCYSGKKECFELKTRSGRSIISTLDHKFLSFNGWCTLANILPGDHIAVNWQIDVNENKNKLSIHEAELIGLLIGDGRLGKHRTQICISKDEPEILRRTKQLLYSINQSLELRCGRHEYERNGRNYNISINESRANKNAPEYIPNPVNDLIKRVGLTGKCKEYKFIPNEIFTSGKDVWFALLLGLWQSDGWMSIRITSKKTDQCTIGFTNRSSMVAQGCQHLLLRFGIRSRLRFRMMLCTTTGKRHPSWQLEILANSQSQFLKIFGESLANIGCQTHLGSNLRKLINAKQNYHNSEELIPYKVWDTISSELIKNNISWYNAAPIGLKKAGPNLYRKRNCNTKRDIIDYFGKKIKNKYLINLGNSHVMWDGVISITKVGIRDTYDIEVISDDNEPNFSANDIITHNSAIGFTVAQFFRSSYILTPQKILQDQYMGDFAFGGKRLGKLEPMVDLKGRNAYPCNYWDNKLSGEEQLPEEKRKKYAELSFKKLGCDKGECKRQNKGKLMECVDPTVTCPYFERLHEAMGARVCLMNFHSFLFQTSVVKQFGIRNLLVLDEAHNAESILMKFIEVNISDRHLSSYGIKIPELQTVKEYIDYFISVNIINVLSKRQETAIANEDLQEVDEIKNTKTRLEFLYKSDPTRWISIYEENKSKSSRTISIKPIFVDNYARQYLFNMANHILIMSATILNKKIICESLGIQEEEVASFRLPSTFPVKNRPIYYRPCGSMSFKNKADTLPKMLEEVNNICEYHKDERGIIHTHTFEITKYILDNCSINIKNRLLFQNQTEFSGNKSILMEKHKSINDSIIIAPAMHEGIDLYDDLGRFQLICKIPYPSLKDPQIAARMELSQSYYDFLSCLKISQSYGRIYRHMDDWGVTYILDSDFKFFYKKCFEMLPKWFTEAVIWE